jgi:hypothetical protein
MMPVYFDSKVQDSRTILPDLVVRSLDPGQISGEMILPRPCRMRTFRISNHHEVGINGVRTKSGFKMCRLPHRGSLNIIRGGLIYIG